MQREGSKHAETDRNRPDLHRQRVSAGRCRGSDRRLRSGHPSVASTCGSTCRLRTSRLNASGTSGRRSTDTRRRNRKSTDGSEWTTRRTCAPRSAERRDIPTAATSRVPMSNTSWRWLRPHDSGLKAEDMLTFLDDPLNLTLAMPYENRTARARAMPPTTRPSWRVRSRSSARRSRATDWSRRPRHGSRDCLTCQGLLLRELRASGPRTRSG